MSSSVTPEIFFYLPERQWPAGGIPRDADSCSGLVFLNTALAWTLQTFLRLRDAGFPCTLTSSMPEEGVVLAFRGSLDFNLKPGRGLLLVCMMADAGPHTYAQLHVVQNPRQTQTVKNSHFMPHWPQPGLIPRDRARAARFETIAYFGCPANLAKELKCDAWERRLESQGLSWRMIGPESEGQIDYSAVDAIVAVRSFDGDPHICKPASKLYNAWRAGVPAILGRESAYHAERKTELDYLEVSSPDEALEAIRMLKGDGLLRDAVVDNGFRRAEEIDAARMTQRWREFIRDVAVPAFYSWREKTDLERKVFFCRRYLGLRCSGIRNRSGGVREAALKLVAKV